MTTMTKALTVGIALAVLSGGVVAATAATPDSGDDGTAQTLSFAREEERMARDLYQLFADTYDQARAFANVTKAEQRHFDAVGRLLTAYGVADPAAKASARTYADPVHTGVGEMVSDIVTDEYIEHTRTVNDGI